MLASRALGLLLAEALAEEATKTWYGIKLRVCFLPWGAWRSPASSLDGKEGTLWPWWCPFPRALQSWPYCGCRVFLAPGSYLRATLKFLMCPALGALTSASSYLHQPALSRPRPWLDSPRPPPSQLHGTRAPPPRAQRPWLSSAGLSSCPGSCPIRARVCMLSLVLLRI